MTCPKCGGPTIELFTSRACKAECDRQVHVKMPLTPPLSFKDKIDLASKRAPSIRCNVRVTISDPYSYLPITGLTTASVDIALIRPGEQAAVTLMPVKDFDLIEVGHGTYCVSLIEPALNAYRGGFVVVMYKWQRTLWTIS